MPGGIFVTGTAWKAILRRDAAWQAAWQLAKLCERPATP